MKKIHVTIIKGNGFPLRRLKTNPNDPCRCGSGKKAKKCCGANTKYYYSKLNQSQIAEQKRKEELRSKQLIESNKNENPS
jgi:NAD(P)H-dependent flavin oxidoreductase YrpB (nitropropane dioxygenase family)